MLTLDTYSWTTLFIIMGSKTKAEPKSSKTTDEAKSMAISFLEARNFNEKELILVKENAIATDAENISTVVSFDYHYQSNEDYLLSITVDCIQGQIKSAMFDPGIPHKFKQDFKLTKDQAKEALIKELNKQSIVEYQIQSGRRLRGKAYREVETPMYEFIVILQKQVSAEVSPYQNWYVNGLTGEVGQADDFPEIRASLDHE